MIRIDLVGPPGVGKTNLYNYISQKRKKPYSWYTVAEGRKMAVRKAMKFHRKSFSEFYLLNLSVNIPLFSNRFVKRAQRKVSSNEFEILVREYEEFFRWTLNRQRCTDSNVYQRIQYYLSFMKTLRSYSFLNRWLNDVCVIWDESITHKLFAILPWDSFNLELVEQYCLTMPHPDAIINIEDSPESISKNILNRQIDSGRITLGHRNSSLVKLDEINRNAILMVGKSLEVLAALGIPILNISRHDGHLRNVASIDEFIKKLIENCSNTVTPNLTRL
jgi:adenylate kinase